VFLLAGTTFVHAQGAGIEWDILTQEVFELYRQGKYDRAAVVAHKALEVAKENVGPDHLSLATSLNNLAELYRATKRDKEALELVKLAERISSIKR
jgi:tetratricopeptide (TPR) repeat protein